MIQGFADAHPAAFVIADVCDNGRSEPVYSIMGKSPLVDSLTTFT